MGGDLIDYFDPWNDDDALAKIERLLFEPDYLAAREARLQNGIPPADMGGLRPCTHLQARSIGAGSQGITMRRRPV
jgi:hypothetical protein